MLSWKFQTKEKFKKLHLIINQILTSKTLWIFIKSLLQNHILFLVIETTLSSDNSLRIRKNLLETMQKRDINREAAKISAVSSGKIDEYEYLRGEEILPSDQSRIIEQTKFTYSPLGKAFEKQINTIKE